MKKIKRYYPYILIIAALVLLTFSSAYAFEVQWFGQALQTTIRVLSPGDANEDGTVNFADFTALAAHFGTTHDAAFADGDFDSNGRVDFADFLMLAANFGVTYPDHS